MEEREESKMDKNNVSIIINGNKTEKRAETTLEIDTHTHITHVFFCTEILKYTHEL